MYLVVGLGNPGQKYKTTRHNLGFMCIDYISQRFNIPIGKVKFKAIIGEGLISNQKVLLAKPQTYMNLSGESVREISEWYKIEPGNIIIIYDDINLELGKIRIRQKGSAGGHNGLKSIIYNLNTDIFPRVRIGIKGELGKMDLADFVLSNINNNEKEILFESIVNVSKAVELTIQGEIQKAMNAYN